MTLAIIKPNNVFPLRTKMQYYHLQYPNVLCYFKKLLILMSNIMLIISGRDTLPSLECSPIPCMAGNAINSVVVSIHESYSVHNIHRLF